MSDDESTAPAAETEDQSEAQSEGETEGQAEPTDTDSADSEPTDAEPTEPDRPAGRRRARVSAAALGLAVAAVIGAGAWAGAAVQPYLADRAAVTTRLQVARAATTAITTLWTYTPEDIGTLPDRVADYLTGDLAAQYRKDIEAIAVRYRQAEISLDSEVVGVAVDTVNGDDARALVYTNTTWSSPQTKDIPGLQYRSYVVTLRRDANRWRVARLEPITNFSLTPQF
ncbi:mammalian cell entry protein [Mycolicibacillus koreensis]|uniref:mammalian cell entry protein n=1 Tax=Mycolicibacillus koreensis TaxID=1069220 RepID=UPI000B18234A|nr:mammalian cell entry protein [Mycolicibacillus koreensis]BBY55679.1 Mce associated membrane protein [Mycolicibacillus koreensis]